MQGNQVGGGVVDGSYIKDHMEVRQKESLALILILIVYFHGMEGRLAI